jgi:hypothetical protein
MREKEKYTGQAGQTGRHIENLLLERLFNDDPSTKSLINISYAGQFKL